MPTARIDPAVMPSWVTDTLLAVALVAVIMFLAGPAAALGRRGTRAVRAAWPHGPGGDRAVRLLAAEMARIVLAEHERLIVTYSVRDHVVYVLTPPGEDPRAVLRAARLVVPDDAYEQLADHLGVPPDWPQE